ncbi:MAG: DUF2852 domain-containing protein [Hyphomicrobiaceae bacterium]
MTDIVARLDTWGQPAWIALMVVAFVVFWPIGLAILFYLIWSGRMGCGRNGSRARWQQRMSGAFEDKMNRWRRQAEAFEPTGNAAFDEYRDETLRRLEDEAREFTSFLERLRMAKDRQEFEQFMAERRARPQTPPSEAGNPQGGTPGPAPSGMAF